jgi:hypothetical protein
MKVRIAMSGIFGALFFLLLPIYDILLQQNTSLHPLVRIVSILILMGAIIFAVFTSKKFAYYNHDYIVVRKNNEIKSIPKSEQRTLNLMSIGTVSVFILFLIIKINVSNNVSFFFQSHFGTAISLILSTMFYISLIWSAFTLIQNHLEETYPNTFVTQWGKQLVKVQTDSHKPINLDNQNLSTIHKRFSLKPPI